MELSACTFLMDVVITENVSLDLHGTLNGMENAKISGILLLLRKESNHFTWDLILPLLDISFKSKVSRSCIQLLQ